MRKLITAAEVGTLARPCYADDAILDALILESEREDIKPRIGDALFVELKSTEEENLSEAESVLLIGGEWTDRSGAKRIVTGLKTALAYFVYARVVRDGNIVSTRYGARVKTEENSNESEKEERQRQYRQVFSSADFLLAECLSYINEFPEAFCQRVEPVMKSNRARYRVMGAGVPSGSSSRAGGNTTIISGKEGKSAYEIAVEHGFVGSVAEWLLSLHGENGESVYDILHDAGLYEGTYEEFVAYVEEMFTRSAEAVESAENAASAAYSAAASATSAVGSVNTALASLSQLSSLVEENESVREEQERQREVRVAAALASLVGAKGDLDVLISEGNSEITRLRNLGTLLTNAENTRKANEVQRQENEEQRQENEADRQSRFDSTLQSMSDEFQQQLSDEAGDFQQMLDIQQQVFDEKEATRDAANAAALAAAESIAKLRNDFNLLAINVDYMDLIKDKFADLMEVSQNVSIVNVIIDGKIYATILPSAWVDFGWLYEYEGGWRLAKVSDFDLQSYSTWMNLLDWMDEEPHSTKIVGETALNEIRQRLTAAESKLTEIEGDIADINEELHPTITYEDTTTIPVDTSEGKRNVDIITGQFVPTSTSGRYAMEFALDGTEVEISVSQVLSFSGNYGYAFLDANGGVVFGKKELGEQPLVIDPTIPISNGAVILRIGMIPNTTATFKRVQTEQTDVLADLENRVEALEERPVGDASPAVVSSAIGGKAGVYKADTLSGTDELIAEDFPTGNKKGDRYNFACDVVSFNGLYFCKGYQTIYGGKWFYIDSSSVTLYGMSGDTETTIEQVSHQLQIDTFLYVNVMVTDEGVAKFVLKTKSGQYTHDFNGWGLNSRGVLKVRTDGSSLSNCLLTANNVDFKKPIWYFGASWETVDSARVFGQLRNLGYFNFLANAWSGRSGTDMFADFKLALNFGTPRMLVAIIANMQIETEAQITTYKNLLTSIKALCAEKGIELVVRTHPNTNAKNYDEVINPFVRSSGVRIVDYYKAMKDPNKTWTSGVNDCYDGYLDSTSHPTTAGAQALALRVLADVPEIMML